METWETILAQIELFLMPIGTIIISVVLAFLFDKIILKKLQQISIKNNWKGDDVIVLALKNISLFLIIAIGIYLASLQLTLPDGIQLRVSKTLMVIIVLLITIVIARMAVGFVKLLPGRSEGAFPGSSIFINITRITIFILGFIFVLQQLGISITPIITALGVGGLAVALALQDTLANLFAGLNVIAEHRLRQGDFIQLENGQQGIVEDITWRNTLLREQGNNNIIIPNTKIASSIIKNYSTPLLEVFAIVKVGVHYNSDLDQVQKVLLAVARQVTLENDEAVKEHEPFVQFTEFADSSINCEVFLKSKTILSRGDIRHAFIKSVQKEFKVQGIQMPFPTRTLVIDNLEAV